MQISLIFIVLQIIYERNLRFVDITVTNIACTQGKNALVNTIFPTIWENTGMMLDKS